MKMDYYINNISEDKLIGRGFEKKCYMFDDVVLLEYRYLNKFKIEDEKDKALSIKNVLDTIDVNSYKIYDIKIVSDKLYVLESKVNGVPLQDLSIGIDSSIYIDRLKQLDNLNLLKKFVIDYFSIIQNGLSIDPSTPNNFLFDGSSVHFIDLGLGNNINDKYVCFYILHNIINTYCRINGTDDMDIISFHINSIYNKLCSIYKELGYDSSMYSLSPNGLISDYIERKINGFKDCIVMIKSI